MNLRRILIVGVMISIFTAAIVLGNKAPDVPESPITDTIEPTDNYDISVESNSPTITPKDITVSNNTDTQFYYKDGKKHYVLSAVDEPNLSD